MFQCYLRSIAIIYVLHLHSRYGNECRAIINQVSFANIMNHNVTKYLVDEGRDIKYL